MIKPNYPDRKNDRRAHRKLNRQTERLMYTRTCRQTWRRTDRRRNEQIVRQTEGKHAYKAEERTGMQTKGLTEIQTFRQPDEGSQ